MYFKPGEQKIKPILNKQQFNERDGPYHYLQITHGKSWIPRRNMTIHKQGVSNKRGPDHPLQSFKNGEGGIRTLEGVTPTRFRVVRDQPGSATSPQRQKDAFQS